MCYDDEGPSFPDALNTHLRFSGGALHMRVDDLHGCRRGRVGSPRSTGCDIGASLSLQLHQLPQAVPWLHALALLCVDDNLTCAKHVLQVAVKDALYTDTSQHELSPPQIRGVIPRLGSRISARQLVRARALAHRGLHRKNVFITC